MAQKSRRNLGERSSSSRNYEWGSSTFRSLSNILMVILMICLLGGVIFSKQVQVPLKIVLGVCLFLLGGNEWLRAYDNKEKGGPKKFSISFFCLGLVMILFGIAAMIFF